MRFSLLALARLLHALLQIWAGVMPVGPSGCSLNSSFRLRDTPEYKLELGTAIESVARVVPDGLLVFFPSYSVMSGCLDAWQAPGNPSVWCVGPLIGDAPGARSSVRRRDRLLRLKHLVVEPRESSGLAAARLDFEAKLEGNVAPHNAKRSAKLMMPAAYPARNGAVLFAVCRGKVSEGLDFADKAGRAVMITGARVSG